MIAVNSYSYADDWQQKLESSNREAQLQREKSQLDFEKYQLESQKMNADSRAFSDLLEAKLKQDEAAKVAQEQEEATKRAEDAAEEVSRQLEQAEVRYKNQIFFGVVTLIITSFLWSVVKKSRQGGIMKYNEKFGIVVVMVCGLLILFALMISKPWVDQLDFIQNLMTTLQIQLFPDAEDCIYHCTYTVDFPTKYAILSFLTLAVYGFITYLGITPPLKKKAK
ncbi:hypothetical protein GALL_541210 [mine drainage metagenome]|uniref:Uncharacterized protein n=1 Tax=mine drainage metagenome TaxID=410659 RepID=A0A1J5P177_9ZZZZ